MKVILWSGADSQYSVPVVVVVGVGVLVPTEDRNVPRKMFVVCYMAWWTASSSHGTGHNEKDRAADVDLDVVAVAGPD